MTLSFNNVNCGRWLGLIAESLCSIFCFFCLFVFGRWILKILLLAFAFVVGCRKRQTQIPSIHIGASFSNMSLHSSYQENDIYYPTPRIWALPVAFLSQWDVSKHGASRDMKSSWAVKSVLSWYSWNSMATMCRSLDCLLEDEQHVDQLPQYSGWQPANCETSEWKVLGYTVISRPKS